MYMHCIRIIWPCIDNTQLGIFCWRWCTFICDNPHPLLLSQPENYIFSQPPNSKKRANIWRMWKLKSLLWRWWLSGDHKSPALFAETPPPQNSEILGQIFAPFYDQPLLWIALFSTTQDYQFPAKRPHSMYGDVSNFMNSDKNFLKKLFILSKWKTVIVQPGSKEVLIKDRTN